MRSTRPTAVFVAEMAVFALVMLWAWCALFRNIRIPVAQSSRSSPPSLVGSFVTLSSESAGRLLTEMGTFLHSNRHGESGVSASEVDPFDLASIPPAYMPLDLTPPKWQPLALVSEPCPLPELMPFRQQERGSYPPAAKGVFVQMSEDLRESSFSFETPVLDNLGAEEGEAAFYVETDVEGRVDRIWRLKTEASAVPALEQTIRRARAKRPCRGEIKIGWSR